MGKSSDKSRLSRGQKKEAGDPASRDYFLSFRIRRKKTAPIRTPRLFSRRSSISQIPRWLTS
jgi:hypothetical protein